MKGDFGPARIALVYALFGGGWILLSDAFVNRIFSSDQSLTFIQTVKGFFYVGVTALLVYALVRYATRRVRLERSRYRELYEHNERQLGALLKVTRAATRTKEDGDPLRAVVEAVSGVMGAARVSVWRYSPDRSTLDCRALFTAADGRHAPGTVIAAADCPEYCRALAGHEVIAATDARTDARTREFIDTELVPHGITSMLDAPLLIRGRPEGVLCVQHAGAPREWTPAEQAFVVSVANLTALVSVQDELRESESRFREMAENVQDLFYNYDPDRDKLLYAGPLFERFWGRSLAEAYADPMSYLENIHPDDRPAARDADRRQRLGEPTETEYRVVRPDGGVSWVLDRSASIIGKDGRVERIVGIMRDVTEIRLAREALAESRRQLATLMDNLPGAVYRCRLDVQWTTLFMSEGITPLTGYKPADFMRGARLEYAELIHPDDRDRVYRDIAAAAAEGRTFEIEYRLLTRAGDEKMVWERGRFFPDRGGGEGHLEGFILDVTDRTKAEAERRLMEERLSQLQKLDAIGQLAGGVAHDFNNMLTIILVRSEMALRHLPPSSPAHAGLREIHDAAERSANLTRQLLTYARRQSATPGTLDISHLVENSLSILTRLAGDGIRLEWRPPDIPLIVTLDPGQADQILVNLCLNARDALAGSGTIRIEARAVTLTEQDCSAHPDLKPGPYVLLSVQDDGIGMDDAMRARIFEPFFTTKDPGKGTGLGLPTVHGIVRQARGTIDVKSTPGQGTFFHIYLPRQEARPASGEESDGKSDGDAHLAMNALPPGHGETILVVGADADLLRLASEILSSLGYSVLVTVSGEEALLNARTHTGEIHLLMSDVELTDMGGRELAERFAVLRPHAGRLFITDAAGGPEAADTVRKPFATAELAIRVRAALGAAESDRTQPRVA